MKILVIQLARLGDIFQSWPTLHALKRKYPTAELHLLTRATFAGAVAFGGVIDRHIALDTREIMSPLVDEKPGIDVSIERLEAFCAQVRGEHYDKIINLSFSVFSSFLTHEIEGGTTDVSGYTRFTDGYLRIPDDGSAYFYAQVGVGRPNRIHVTDLFAHVAGVDLSQEDWSFFSRKLNGATSGGEIVDETIVVHVGASNLGKTLSWSKWSQVVKTLAETWSGTVVLVGAENEREIAERVVGIGRHRRVFSLVGQTTLQETLQIVSEAKLVVGGDSAPVQMASLVGKPVLNISLPMVSFWETGPRSSGSRVLVIANEDDISAEEVAREALMMVRGQPAVLPLVRVPGPLMPYLEVRPSGKNFEWDLLRGLYMAEELPPPATSLFLTGMTRLYDVNQLALEQIAALRKNPQNKTAATILDRVDEIMEQVVQEGLVPEAAPIVRWFQTERLRIGPMPVDQLISSTEAIHRKFAALMDLYLGTMDSGKGVENDGIVLG
jgi:heptosyltransferase III